MGRVRSATAAVKGSRSMVVLSGDQAGRSYRLILFLSIIGCKRLLSHCAILLTNSDAGVGAFGDDLGTETERFGRPARRRAALTGAHHQAAFLHETAKIRFVQPGAGERLDRALQLP